MVEVVLVVVLVVLELEVVVVVELDVADIQETPRLWFHRILNLYGGYKVLKESWYL